MSERKRWKSEEKLALINEIKGKGRVVETCRKYSVDPSMFYGWNGTYDTFDMEGLRFRSRSIEPGMRKLKKENERLKRIIAEKELEVAMLQEVYKKRRECVDP
jgi:transposase-like protein